MKNKSTRFNKVSGTVSKMISLKTSLSLVLTLTIIAPSLQGAEISAKVLSVKNAKVVIPKHLNLNPRQDLLVYIEKDFNKETLNVQISLVNQTKLFDGFEMVRGRALLTRQPQKGEDDRTFYTFGKFEYLVEAEDVRGYTHLQVFGMKSGKVYIGQNDNESQFDILEAFSKGFKFFAVLDAQPYTITADIEDETVIEDITTRYSPIVIDPVYSVIFIGGLILISVAVYKIPDPRRLPINTILIAAIAFYPVNLLTSRGSVIQPDSSYWVLRLYNLPMIILLVKVFKVYASGLKDNAVEELRHRPRLGILAGFFFSFLAFYDGSKQYLPLALLVGPASLYYEAKNYSQNDFTTQLAALLLGSAYFVNAYCYYFKGNFLYIPITYGLLDLVFLLGFPGLLGGAIYKLNVSEEASIEIEDNEKDWANIMADLRAGVEEEVTSRFMRTSGVGIGVDVLPGDADVPLKASAETSFEESKIELS